MTLRTPLGLLRADTWTLAALGLATAIFAGCGGKAVSPPPSDLGVDARTPLPCEGGRPVCRAMSFCGCDEVVPAVVGASCGGGCCPWICPEWTIEESACIDMCGVDGGRRDAGPRDSGVADWRACTDQGQCVLEADSCCGVCGTPALTDFDSVRMGLEDVHYTEVCPAPIPCPGCVGYDVPEFVATCDTGECKGVDVRTLALTACATDADCRVRSVSCCECGGEARYIAVSTAADTEAAYAALVCPAGSACPDCAPVYPPELVPRCGLDAHCTLAAP